MIVLASVVSAIITLLLGGVVFALLRFVKSFGVYAESNRQLVAAFMLTHESNLVLHRAQVAMLEEVRKVTQSLTKVA